MRACVTILILIGLIVGGILIWGRCTALPAVTETPVVTEIPTKVLTATVTATLIPTETIEPTEIPTIEPTEEPTATPRPTMTRIPVPTETDPYEINPEPTKWRDPGAKPVRMEPEGNRKLPAGW